MESKVLNYSCKKECPKWKKKTFYKAMLTIQVFSKVSMRESFFVGNHQIMSEIESMEQIDKMNSNKSPWPDDTCIKLFKQLSRMK